MIGIFYAGKYWIPKIENVDQVLVLRMEGHTLTNTALTVQSQILGGLAVAVERRRNWRQNKRDTLNS